MSTTHDLLKARGTQASNLFKARARWRIMNRPPNIVMDHMLPSALAQATSHNQHIIRSPELLRRHHPETTIHLRAPGRQLPQKIAQVLRTRTMTVVLIRSLRISTREHRREHPRERRTRAQRRQCTVEVPGPPLIHKFLFMERKLAPPHSFGRSAKVCRIIRH